jgi:hypothetical protein
MEWLDPNPETHRRILGHCVLSLDIIPIERSDDAVQNAVIDSESKAHP